MPEGERTPYLARVEALLTQGEALRAEQVAGKAERTVAAETMKRLETEAHGLARQVKGLIIALYPARPGGLKAWGLTFRQGTERILLPTNRAERLAFLARYIAQEEGRPEAERFRVPCPGGSAPRLRWVDRRHRRACRCPRPRRECHCRAQRARRAAGGPAARRHRSPSRQSLRLPRHPRPASLGLRGWRAPAETGKAGAGGQTEEGRD